MAADPLKSLLAQAPDAAERQSAADSSVRMALLAKQLGNPKVQNLDQATSAVVQTQAQEGQQRLDQLKQQQQLASSVGGLVAQREGLAADAAASQQRLSIEELQANKRAQMAQRLQNETLEDRKRETAADIATAKRVQSIGREYDQSLQFATTKQRQDLARLGTDVREQLLDARLQFDKDEAGRKFTNERQLQDFAVATARSEQELRSNLQTIEAAYEKDKLLTEALRDRLSNIVTKGFIDEQNDLDNALKVKLTALQVQAREQAERAANRRRNRMMQSQAIGQVAGMAIGAGVVIATGGLGAAAVPGILAGAGAGSQLGGAAGTMYESEQ